MPPVKYDDAERRKASILPSALHFDGNAYDSGGIEGAANYFHGKRLGRRPGRLQPRRARATLAVIFLFLAEFRRSSNPPGKLRTAARQAALDGDSKRTIVQACARVARVGISWAYDWIKKLGGR